jgi:hypothetical protein
VRDQERGSIGQHRAKTVVHGCLDPRVDRARGVVENQDARVVEDCARERDPLPLTSRQRQATLTDRGVVSARELGDELVRLGDTGSRFDLVVSGVGMAIRDVRPNRVREEKAVLEDNAELPAQRSKLHVPQVVAVNEHGSLGRVVEARHEHGQRRLATAARTDDGNTLAWGDVEVHPSENRASVAVAEVDVGELDVTAEFREVEGIGCVGDGRREVEELEDAFEPCPRLLADGQDPRQLARGCHELGQICRERQERPQGDLVVQREPPAERKDGHLSEQRDRLEERLVARLQAHGSHLRPVHGPGCGRHAFDLALFLAERFDDADPVQILIDDLDEVTLTLLPVPRRREDAPAHPVRDDQQAGCHDNAHERQQRRQIEHDPERKEQQQDVAAHDREEAQEALDQRGVGVRASDQLTRRHPAEVVEVECLEVVVHVIAQVVLDLERNPAATVATHVGEREACGGERDQQEEPWPERRRPGENDAVDDLTGDQRDSRLTDAAKHRGSHGQHDITSVPEHVAPEAPDPTGLGGSVAQPRSLVVR